MADLDAVAFTHHHADHSSDFAALVKSSYFEQRTRPLPVFGPPGNERVAGTAELVSALFSTERGIYRYLGEYLQPEGPYQLLPQDIDPPAGEIVEVFANEHIRLRAARVVHGTMPSLAWVVDAAGSRYAFSGDTAGTDEVLRQLASDADVFVAHHTIPEDLDNGIRTLHMPPSLIGQIARDAGVKMLLLSHRMQRTIGKEAESEHAIRGAYAGPLQFAEDLDCIAPH
jgi:ribonuclease BN (tRNA processing enzyme)